MRWIYPLAPETEQGPDVLGGKAHGLVMLRRLRLPVPPGFVIGTEACRAFLRHRRFPDGLDDELAAAVAELEATTGRRLGGPERPLVVSVRSGGGVSMPGMMTTILNLGLTSGFAAAATDGEPIPDDAIGQLRRAVAAVFSSWNSPRATTYRELHGVPHDLGTAVTVQAMVFGNRDDHSGAGVAFSRNPNTGEPVPFGEVLFGRQGDEVVSGESLTRPLHELAEREPAVWAGLLDALRRVEEHHRDACCLEFTFEAGELWLLQARPGQLAAAAAVRTAVDLADEGMIGRHEALLRVSPRHLQLVRTPRIVGVEEADVLARGLGAVPGVAVGRVATTADRAVRMAADGPVILVRPATSPLDLRGLAAAAGVVTARGGPASHAAVVARAMGKPAVVGVAGLTVDVASARAGAHRVPEGARIAIDGTGGEVVLGTPRVATTAADPHLRRLLDWADEVSGDNGAGRDAAERLGAALTALAARHLFPERVMGTSSRTG
jgi:pyruvate,orthophosphate dikinase